MVISVYPERRVVWHPRQENKFVVGGGTQITLYEWAPDYPEIRHITSQHDLQHMRCFAWSPNPEFDDLVAVGLSSGQVNLLRLEATKYARENGVLSSGPHLALPVRNSRSCNALAFSTADPNYLAVGLDKVRGDCSLIIWDITAASPALSLSPSASPSVYAGVSMGSRAHMPPSRTDGARSEIRVFQQHAVTEVVSSLAFLPQSSSLLLAGISHRWLRLFDLRSPSPSTTNIASKVHGIVTDPFDTHRIGCFGEGTVTIWDARKFPQPLLTFTEKDAAADGAKPRSNSMYTMIEFSSTRRGQMATLEKDATRLRFWDILRTRVDSSVDGRRSTGSSLSSRGARRSWPNLPWTAPGPNSIIGSSHETDSHAPAPKLVLSDTRKTRDFNRPLTSFALVPNTSAQPLTSNVLLVNKDGDLELYAVHDTPKQAVWSSRGNLAIGAGYSCRIIAGFDDGQIPPEPWDIQTHSPYRHHRSATPSRSSRPRNGSSIGRGKSSSSAYPRRDDDEFSNVKSSAAVTSSQDTPDNITSKNGKSRTYSPAALRNYNHQLRHAVSAEFPKRRPSSPNDDLPRGRSRRSRHENNGRGTKHFLRSFTHVVEDDMSMKMRQRTIQGYGLTNLEHNSIVCRDDRTPSDEQAQKLSELWAWMHHSSEILSSPTSRLHGYDFSNQGLLGIWEGFAPLPSLGVEMAHREHLGLPGMTSTDRRGSRRSHSPVDDFRGDFHAAVVALASRRGSGKVNWRPIVVTSKLEERHLALRLCGWSLTEEDMNNTIKKWERDGKHPQAACWLVFRRQFSSAMELLMRSKDESHHMMSGTLAALIPHGSNGPNKSPELRNHCERLIVRLSDPYFRTMLTHLALGDWSDVLDEEAIPFRERLAIAFQFLDDSSLSLFLRRLIEKAHIEGDIDALVVTGLTPAGMDILQGYVDRTSDFQSAAIMSSFVCPTKFFDHRVERWTEAYRDFLDGLKLFHHRVAFDIERGQILQDGVRSGDLVSFEWVPRQILIRCNYCNKAISLSGPAARATSCPNCGRALPRCSICLMTLGIVQDNAREAELLHSQYRDTIDDAIVICQTCRHGGHASHILDWFFGEDGSRSHGTCAVADCDCRCADEM